MSQQSQTPRNHTRGKLRVNVMGLRFEPHGKNMFNICEVEKWLEPEPTVENRLRLQENGERLPRARVNICTLPQRGWNNIPNKTPEELPRDDTWLQKCQSDQHLWEMLQRQEWHSELNPWKSAKRYWPSICNCHQPNICEGTFQWLVKHLRNKKGTPKELRLHSASWYGCI